MKFTNTATIASFFALLMLNFSCTQFDSLENNVSSIQNKSVNNDQIYLDLYQNIQATDNTTEQMQEYELWKINNNLSEINTESWSQFNDLSNEETITILENQSLYSEDVINSFRHFQDNLSQEEDLEKAINLFEQELSNLNLTSIESTRTNNFIEAINTVLRVELSMNKSGDCGWIGWLGCAAATYSLANAVIALTAVAATVIGVVIALVGYAICAILWYAACDPCLSR